jgi:hypothetical protein
MVFRNINTTILKTPKVTQTAKDHYNCSSLKGMQLENQGNSATIGSHWEKSILFNEIMNP